MLLERIESDLKSAMKEKNEIKVSAIRMLKAAIKNKEIEKRVKALTDDEIIDVVAKQVKQRRDSIVEFEKGKRQDLVDKETKEISVLEYYLPARLSKEELTGIVQKIIQSSGAKTKADMGKVMKEVMAETKGKADGSEVSRLVSSLLS